MHEHCSGLRERKRRDTRQRIFEAALELVEKHGVDDVTVEDICAAADISRRTFFNYMDSKDQAILGPFPFALTPDALDAIASTQSDNLLDLVLEHVAFEAEGVPRELLERRRIILADNHSLAVSVHMRKTATLTKLAEALRKHFETFPGDRTLPDAPVSVEVHVIVNYFHASVSLNLSNPDFPATESPGSDALRLAARFHTDFAQEISW